MRKYLLILFSAIAFVACSSDEEGANVIQPVKASADVETFFQSEIENQTGDSQTILPDPVVIIEGVEGYGYRGPDTCCLVNSAAELAAIYAGNKQLPDIDFTQYTLVVGKETMPEIPYFLNSMSLTETDDLLELTLNVKGADSRFTTSYQMRYWSLYPKLPNKRIVVKVIGRPGAN